MSKYGYIGKDSDIPQQAFRSNAGVLSVNDHLALSKDHKLTQFGQLELIETKEYSTGVTEIDFTDLGNYETHLITYTDCGTSNTATNYPSIQFYENGTLQTGNGYAFGVHYLNTNSTANGEFRTNTYNRIVVAHTTDEQTHSKWNGYTWVYSATDSKSFTYTTSHISLIDHNGYVGMSYGSGIRDSNTLVDGIRFMNSGNTFGSYKISLYGLRTYNG